MLIIPPNARKMFAKFMIIIVKILVFINCIYFINLMFY